MKAFLQSPDLPLPVEIQQANLIFSDRFLNLTSLNMKLGDNDLNITGRVENYLAYMLRDKTLLGEMMVTSRHLNLNDFMREPNGATVIEIAPESDPTGIIEIPENLDLKINGKVSELNYEEMKLSEAVAAFSVQDGVVHINKMNVNAFGGKMALTGNYSSQNPEKPVVDFDIDLNQISFAEIFDQVETLRKFAPIFEKLDGKFNTKLSLNSLLDSSMTPILSSVLSKGSFKAELVHLKDDIKTFGELAKALKVEEFSDFSLRDLALAFEIKDGKLITTPFNLRLKDFNLNLGGSTGLDSTIDYIGSVKLPDKLKAGRFNQVGFKIGGNFLKPTIKLDVKDTFDSIVQEEKDKITDQLIKKKEELIDKGKQKRDEALEEAEKQAAKLIEQAKSQSEKLILKAWVQADSLVAKASNPIAKELAKKGADELIKVAEKQADKINENARIEADKLIQTARDKSEL